MAGINNTYILYNPYSGNGSGKVSMEALRQRIAEQDPIPVDMTAICDYAELVAGLAPDDRVIVCGGDGTLNRFVNDTDGMAIPCEILYCAAGSGNDFLKDIGGAAGELIPVGELIRDLPVITVNGIRRRFINCAGLGLDGYCCEEVRRARESGGRVNYITIAIRGLLREYSTMNATVTVDGETTEYSRVWLAVTMKGRYFGGGVMAAPDQDRRDPDGAVTLAVMSNVGRLRALTIFPTLMNGTHIKYKKVVHMHRGGRIHVKLDRPTILQIDGETMLGVTEYTVESPG